MFYPNPVLQALKTTNSAANLILKISVTRRHPFKGLPFVSAKDMRIPDNSG
jgi:hypothetical protein